MKLFRPSGGGLYHLRARGRRTLWRPFRHDLESWLRNWSTPSNRLVLIGPSAGYTLTSTWLKGFASIHAYDLDPLAPWLFQREHGVKAVFSRQDLFWRDRKLSLEPLEKMLKTHQDASILFCNVLGQVPLEGACTEREWQQFLKQLRNRLNNLNWASYHDLFTLEPLPQRLHAEAMHQLKSANSDPRQLELHAVGVEVIDHLTASDWTRGLSKHRLSWSLSPRSLHIIECVTGH